MDKAFIVKGIIVAICAYFAIRLFLRYGVMFILFMLNEPTKWDKQIDKPRLLFHIIGLILLASPFYSNGIQQLVHSEGLLVQLSYWMPFLAGAFIIQLSWTSKFKNVYGGIKKKISPFRNLETTFSSEAEATKIYERFSQEGYIKTDIVAFMAFVNLKTPIKRIIWQDKIARQPKRINRQSLIEFVSNLVIGFESLENKQIIALIDRYFCNPSQQSIKISSKNVTDWRNNDSAYLRKISNLIKA
ncbi:MAG: hypothetical protein NXH90_00550 [Flavobacteriaceae bacterium]|nr:hypothetical protein [Flavobacteriaceae bacterium]